MGEIGYAGAFLGGVLTLLSPCAAMLLPSFFAYSFAGRGSLIGRTALFLAGLLITLVPLGAGAGAAGALLVDNRTLAIRIGAGLVIAFGVLLAIGVPFPGFTSARAGTGALAVVVLGMTYGLAGTCTGPILGSLLTFAVVSGNPVYGSLLFVCFALGMVAPLFLLAAVWDRFGLADKAWLKPRPITVGPVRTTLTALISGLLFIGLGALLILTDGTASLGGLLSPDQQFDLEVFVRGIADSIPDLFTLLIVAGLVGVVAWLWTSSRERSDRAS